MKSRRIAGILGIALIFTLLFVILPAAPILAANTITLTPSQGAIGVEIAIHGEFDPTTIERFGIIYVSPSNLSTSTSSITSAPSYEKVVSAVFIPMQGMPNAGIFNCNFDIPATLTDGTVAANVAPGQYYVYVTTTLIGGGESNILAKASLTVTAPVVPTLDALSPASGPSGTSVTVSGSNFPVSTALVFKFDTTTLTPTAGDNTTRSTGLFLSTITIPSAILGVHAISATAGVVTLSANFTVTSNAAITLSASSGTAGASITINGTGFPANMPLLLRFDSTAVTPTSGSTTTGTTGTFSSVITIPTTAATGAHTITAIAGAGTDAETYNVTGGGSITMNITPNNGPVGTVINFYGTGLAPNHSFTVSWNGATTNVTGTTGTDGSYGGSFTVPPTAHGVKVIAVNDGTTTANANFTVESTPPATPQPLRPYMDEGVSAPITLDWEDVTDPSLPVTYSVQISASDNFTTNLVNLTGLATSQYILTEADLLNFTTGQTYYWREKAVDAAQNESAWTGANSFNITQGFQFTGWVLWVSVAVGAIILFLLGIWIGRKTAYSY